MSVASPWRAFPAKSVWVKSNYSLPRSVFLVIHSAVNHRPAFRCAPRSLHRVLAAAGFIYLFGGNDPSGAASWGRGVRGAGGGCWGPGCSWARARAPPAPFPMRPRSRGRVCGWGGGLPRPSPWPRSLTKVSCSSPPVGQLSKSACKFPPPPRPPTPEGGEEALFVFQFFSLYVDTKRKLGTGHVRMLNGLLISNSLPEPKT